MANRPWPTALAPLCVADYMAINDKFARDEYARDAAFMMAFGSVDSKFSTQSMPSECLPFEWRDEDEWFRLFLLESKWKQIVIIANTLSLKWGTSDGIDILNWLAGSEIKTTKRVYRTQSIITNYWFAEFWRWMNTLLWHSVYPRGRENVFTLLNEADGLFAETVSWKFHSKYLIHCNYAVPK